MRRPRRFAVLALMILCWGVSLVSAQSPVTRPAISEEASPVEEFSVETQDGQRAIGVLRRPPGPGPFPAVVIPYPFNVSRWKTMALHNSTMTRFLAAGYVTVMTSWNAPREEPAALSSTLAIVDHVKNMSEVDPNSVILYGCSTGGYMVLRVAAETEVAAITAEEPPPFGFGYDVSASVATEAEWVQLNEDSHRFFTPEVRQVAQERIRKISGPIFFAQGEVGALSGPGMRTMFSEMLAFT